MSCGAYTHVAASAARNHDLARSAGLLGGAVYVNAFTLLAKEVEPSLREFSLSAASLADSVGIALADICGIMVQASPILPLEERVWSWNS